MRHLRFTPLVTIAPLLMTTIPVAVPDIVQAQEVQVYAGGGFIFETPVGFSDLKPIGDAGFGVLYPATAAKGSQRLLITLVDLRVEDLVLLRMDEEQLFSYVKYLHFGLSGSAYQYQQRQFMGQALRGQVQVKSNQHIVELYLVPLSDGSKLAVAFEIDPELPLMLVENTITAVTRSLREDPKAFKKRRKR